jgi:hypothetical protein
MPLASFLKIPAAIILTLLLFANLAAEEDFPFIGIVNEDGINIRSDSTVSSAIIGQAEKGNEVTVIRQAYDWYKIRFPLGALSGEPLKSNFAWIHKKFVERRPQVPEALVREIEETQEPAADEINVTGIIKPYGRVFGRKATHKLITEDKEVFLLKGDRKALNALDSMRVKIIGIKEKDAPKKNKYPLIEVKMMEKME